MKSPDMPILVADNVSKHYRLGRVDVPVLRGVSVEVERGEWVAILGASGSGKSTLLHLLGGLDRPSLPGDRRSPAAGKVLFDGRALGEMSMRDIDRYRNRSVGFVFQFYHLLPELNVIENASVARARHSTALAM